MPKKFYTERDIEDLFASGVLSLEVSEKVVLTELAYEKARQLGIRLGSDLLPPPSAPIRPYLSKVAKPIESQAAVDPSNTNLNELLRQRVRESVAARLGNQVDPVLLDTIIMRILSSINL
jgi:hypothetical protein